jgi:hypothetical protein
MWGFEMQAARAPEVSRCRDREGPTSARMAVWRAMQTELLAESSNAQHVIASASSHDVHLQQPQIVIDAIRRIVDISGGTRQGAPGGVDP